MDDVVCINETENLTAIGQGYKKFDQTTDEEVISLLEKAQKKNI